MSLSFSQRFCPEIRLINPIIVFGNEKNKKTANAHIATNKLIFFIILNVSYFCFLYNEIKNRAMENHLNV